MSTNLLRVQADDLAGKVYGVNTGLASLDDPDSGGTGLYYLGTRLHSGTSS